LPESCFPKKMFGSSHTFGDSNQLIGGSTQGLTMGFGERSHVGSNGEAPMAKRKKDEPPQTCLPVTIHAIETAISQNIDEGKNAELKFYGVEHGMLILVAVVEELVRKETSLEFTLNDSTGRIKAKFYTHGQQPQEYDGIVPGRYVYLFGNVRTSPNVHFAITGLRLVTSANEISYHMIESAYAALKLRRDVPHPATPMLKQASDAAKEHPTGMNAMDLSPSNELSTMAALETSAEVVTPRIQLEGLELNNAILAFIRKEGDGKPEGVALANIRDHCAQTHLDAVRGALQQLVVDAEIFTTLDDDHFQSL